MDSHRRALLHRALATAGVATLTATAAFVAPASADHPGHDKEECRGYAQVPNPFVKLVAENFQFDTNCLQAPADRNFRIYFQNNDSDAHNVSIYDGDPGSLKTKQLYKGKAIKGPGQEEYAIEGLPAGKYYFQDDKTPDMNGWVKVEKAKKAG